MTQGKYVVIEGNDGTGKSTQVELLAQWLREEKGIESFIAHEPAGTPMADALRTIIKDGTLARSPETNLLLFTAARHEIWQQACQALTEGKWVLSARNYISTLAYQGGGEGLSSELIESTTRQFTDDRYINPDLTIVLTLADETIRAERISQRGELEQKDTFESQPDVYQQRVNQAYLDIADHKHYQMIDASQSIRDIQQQIRQNIDLA